MIKKYFYNDILKRWFDLVFGLLFFLIASPIIIFFGIWVFFEDLGSPLFIQERVGRYGIIFKIFKLRSMSQKLALNYNPKKITKTGWFIRRFKIDELPQLLNIFKGDMSFVGPRPGLPSMSKNLDENGIIRLKVRPGLTGWADVNGGIYLPWPERWVFDRYYVENISFRLDLKILLRTFNVVLFGENYYLKKKP